MSTLTIELPNIGALVLEEMTVLATELAEGDILARDTTREIAYAVAYEGADGPCVEYVLRPVGLTGASLPHYIAADVEVAILRPMGGAS